MKNDQRITAVPKIPVLEPLRVKQAIAGLEMKQTDEKMLQYLNFLADWIPIDAVAFLHLLPSYGLFSHLFADRPDLAEEQKQQKVKLLNQMKEKIARNFEKRPAMTLTHDVQQGDPLAGLLQRAKEVSADLMVVGQKKQEGGHGILTRKLTSLVSTPALIIPAHIRPSLKKILVPVDFSANAVQALEMAIRIREQMEEKPTIVCLHIYELPEFTVREAFRALVREDKEKALNDFTAPYTEQGYGPFETVLLEREFLTRIARYLLDYALEQEIDLIVIGAKGLSLVEKLKMGSVTERLLTINDDIPLLVVK